MFTPRISTPTKTGAVRSQYSPKPALSWPLRLSDHAIPETVCARTGTASAETESPSCSATYVNKATIKQSDLRLQLQSRGPHSDHIEHPC